MDSSKFMDADINDLIRDPKKYGCPTFDEFKSNPNKYRKEKDHLFNVADTGTKNLGSVIKQHIYWMCGTKCNSVEHAQQVMLDKGLSMDDLEVGVDLEDIGNSKAIAHVKFRKKKHQSNLILPEGY